MLTPVQTVIFGAGCFESIFCLKSDPLVVSLSDHERMIGQQPLILSLSKDGAKKRASFQVFSAKKGGFMVQGMADWPARMKEMVDFVGLTPEESELIKSTGPLLVKHAEALTAAVYDHFLNFPEARKFFLAESGEVDQERIDRRKHSLTRWLQASIDFKIEEDFPVFLLAMAVVHSHPPTHREHLGSIPARYMIGTISFAQTAIAGVLAQEMDDPAEALRASVVWNKALMVQLDVLLAGYVTEEPIPPQH